MPAFHTDLARFLRTRVLCHLWRCRDRWPARSGLRAKTMRRGIRTRDDEVSGIGAFAAGDAPRGRDSQKRHPLPAYPAPWQARRSAALLRALLPIGLFQPPAIRLALQCRIRAPVCRGHRRLAFRPLGVLWQRIDLVQQSLAVLTLRCRQGATGAFDHGGGFVQHPRRRWRHHRRTAGGGCCGCGRTRRPRCGVQGNCHHGSRQPATFANELLQNQYSPGAGAAHGGSHGARRALRKPAVRQRSLPLPWRRPVRLRSSSSLSSASASILLSRAFSSCSSRSLRPSRASFWL